MNLKGRKTNNIRTEGNEVTRMSVISEIVGVDD